MADLDAIAYELERRAAAVQLIGDRLVHEAAAALWTSVAADAFRATVASRHRDCGEVAELLRAAAERVRHFGLDAQAEQARLARLERAALQGAMHGALHALHGAGAVARSVGGGLAGAASVIGW